MKKILITPLILFTLFGTFACSSKWSKTDPDLSQAYIKKTQSQLEERLNVLKENPEDAVAIFDVGFLYQQLGNFKEAEKFYLQKLEFSPNDYATLNNLAVIYEEVEEYASAAKYIKKLYELNPEVTEVIKDTVRILLKADEPDSATMALENFVTLIKQEDIADDNIDIIITELYDSINRYKKTKL